MTYRELRRATTDEIRVACFVSHVPIEDVVEAWVDCAGNCEIVLKGFVRRHTVNVSTAVKESA